MIACKGPGRFSTAGPPPAGGTTPADHRRRRPAAQAAAKVAAVDGAPWVVHQREGQSLPLDAIGLDCYHWADNVHKARRVGYGADPPATTDRPGPQWAAAVLPTAKHAG